MATIQFVGDENIKFYGTNQLQAEVGFGSDQPIQIVGLVPCQKENESCVGDPCQTLNIFSIDKNSFLFEFTDLSQPADFRLQQWVNNAWEMVDTVIGNGELGVSEGIKFNLGFSPEYPFYAGYELDWGLVFNEYGSGIYRFSAYNSVAPENSLFSYPFYLREYVCGRADDTFKISITQKGLYGNKLFTEDNDQPRIFDIENLTWTDECRYSGKMVIAEPEVVTEMVRTSINRTESYYASENEQYDLNFYSITYEMAQRVRFYGLKSVKVKISDENADNVKDFSNMNIVAGEDYSFETFVGNRILPLVTIKVKNEYNDDFTICK